MTQRITALLVAGNRSEAVKIEVAACLKQFADIGDIRDKMVHRYVNYTEGKLHVHNFNTARTLLFAESESYSKNRFEKSQFRLSGHLFAVGYCHNSQDWEAKTTETKMLIKQLYEPWNYKFAPPKKMTKQTHQLQLEIARQLQSFPPKEVS